MAKSDRLNDSGRRAFPQCHRPARPQSGHNEKKFTRDGGVMARNKRLWLKPPIAAPTQPKNKNGAYSKSLAQPDDNGSGNSRQQASDEKIRAAGNSNATALPKELKEKTPPDATAEITIAKA